MVKLQIEKNGKTENVDLQVKAKSGRELIQKLTILVNQMESSGPEMLKKELEEYYELLDTIASDSTGMSKEQLDDLNLEEKNKITTKIVELARDSLGFSKLSIK